jgi:putative FmdB family regulatory protein
MPIYEYEHDGQSGPQCPARFEVLQRLDDPPLAQCPDCGGACHRVFSSFATTSGRKDLLKPAHLEKHGFTQYRRAGGGYYEKTCGQGPRVIKRD